MTFAPRAVFRVLAGLQIATALTLVGLIGLVLAGTAPTLLGMESFVVLSGSMEPALRVGDLAVVAPTKPDALVPGDVVTYRPSQQPTLVVTHRLVSIGFDEQGRFSFTTKGDANNVVDQVAVNAEAVLGKVVYSIPKLGYLVEFAKQPQGRILLIAIPGLLLVVDYILGTRRRLKGRATPMSSEAAELLARGRIALNNGASNAALSLFDEAIASDPRLEQAWILKSECLEGGERTAVLRAGLTVNPGSAMLRHALDQSTASFAQNRR
jgi:signal peptidase I